MDDAGVYRLGDDTALVLTVDFFPPVIDDPYNYGAIAVANSLSDIYAMGGRPLLGLNIVGFPVELPKNILGEILRGGSDKAQEAGCLIIGGHTVDDREPKYGLAAVGLVEPGKEGTVAGAKALSPPRLVKRRASSATPSGSSIRPAAPGMTGWARTASRRITSAST